jgi:hypothetical protein
MNSCNDTYSFVGAFPHSDICGSRLICSSPQLFAAYHVLLRRLMPRHPPYALSSLIFVVIPKFSFFLQDSFSILEVAIPTFSYLLLVSIATLISLFSSYAVVNVRILGTKKAYKYPLVPNTYYAPSGIIANTWWSVLTYFCPYFLRLLRHSALAAELYISI